MLVGESLNNKYFEVCVIDQAPGQYCPIHASGAAVRACMEYGIARVRGQ